METKEIVALMEKWLEQIKQITVDYQLKVDELAKARQDYEKQTKKWYIAMLPYVIPLITFIIVTIIFVIAIRFVGCPNPIKLAFQDIIITQTCDK